VLEAGANRALGGGGPVSFNAGLMDLDREAFVEKLERAARDARAAGSGIILELLEGDFGKADQKHLELIQELRAKGCLIALDDFGTGYSNYARASSFPLDIMKFDRALIGRAFAEKSEAILIGDLVQFCADRGVLTVAEGIETDHLADLAALMGFDFGQGFYWTRPLPELEAAPARMTSLLAKKLGRS
jgi:EAL domain-containing protein (putative c-di-GMP-specific phosphodiesterase class I)